MKYKIFYSTLKNALAFYNTGDVAEHSKVVGLAPEWQNKLVQFVHFKKCGAILENRFKK
jgi:hypothetical protein